MERSKLRDNAMLSSRDGRLFLSAQALDALAIGIAQVALPWLALDATGSQTVAGLVFAVQILPYVVFGLPAGLVADRYPRRRVIWCAHASQAVFAMVIPVWYFAAGVPPVLVVGLSAFLIGAARAFSDAGAFGAIASIVGAADFTSGQAVLGSAWSIGLIGGPAIGGALIATIGPAPTLTAQAVAFTLAMVAVICVRSDFGRPEPSEGGIMAGLAGGVRYLLTDPLLRTLTGIGVLWNVASAGSQALLVPLLRDEVSLSSHEAGIVLAGGAFAGIAAAPIVHRLSERMEGPQLYAATVLWSAPVTAALGLVTSFWLAVPAVFLFNLVGWIVMSCFIGERQRRAPAELQGRVGISGRMLMTGSMAVGAALASALTGVMGLRELYVLMGVATFGVWLLAVPLITRARARLALARG
jgi:MFS family permease